VIAILLALWTLVGVLALVWLVWRAHQRRLARRQAVTQAVDNQDADWIYGNRVERRPAGPTEEAKREAEAIVTGAKLEAQEILARAQRARDHVEVELAREQAQVAEKSKKLTEFLAHALEQVERASANGAANDQDLDELEAMRKELGSAE
jgi:hypothetical protein